MAAADGPKGANLHTGGTESSADAAAPSQAPAKDPSGPETNVTRGRGRGRPQTERSTRTTRRDAPEPRSTSPSVQQLVDSCQGMVKTVAFSIHQRLPKHVDIDDLIGYGQLGLAQAAETFRPERGKFGTFAFYRIRGAILDGLSKMSWFSRHEYHARRYEQMANEALAIEACEHEAVDASPAPEENARWFRHVTGSLTVVYLASGLADDDAPAGELRDDRSPRPDERAAEVEVQAQLRALIEELPSDAGNLIRMTYYEGMTITEAAGHLGVSKSWASRLHARTLKRLAAAMNRLGVYSEVA